MRDARTARLTVMATGMVAVALSACAHHDRAPAPSVSSPSRTMAAQKDKDDPTGQEVLAIVERLELKAHTEHLSDGSVMVSNIVAFGVIQPKRLDTLVIVHSRELPIIGTRRVQLGDLVQFVLPPNWRNRDLSIADLENLRFRD